MRLTTWGGVWQQVFFGKPSDTGTAAVAMKHFILFRLICGHKSSGYFIKPSKTEPGWLAGWTTVLLPVMVFKRTGIPLSINIW